MPHGRALIVHNSKKVETDILPRYFKQTKIKSFLRQLNKWGFKRLTGKGPDEGSYFHELFLRGMPWLVTSMRYVKVKGTSSTTATTTTGSSCLSLNTSNKSPSNSGNSASKIEPDFYALNRIRPLNLLSPASDNSTDSGSNKSAVSSPTSQQTPSMATAMPIPMIPVTPMAMYIPSTTTGAMVPMMPYRYPYPPYAAAPTSQAYHNASNYAQQQQPMSMPMSMNYSQSMMHVPSRSIANTYNYQEHRLSNSDYSNISLYRNNQNTKQK